MSKTDPEHTVVTVMNQEQFDHEFGRAARKTIKPAPLYVIVRPMRVATGPRYYGWLLVDALSLGRPARWACFPIGNIPKPPHDRHKGNNYFIHDDEGPWCSWERLALLIRGIASDNLYDVMTHID